MDSSKKVDNIEKQSKTKKRIIIATIIVIPLIIGIAVGLYFLLSKTWYTVRVFYNDILVDTYEVEDGDYFELSDIEFEGYDIIGVYDNKDLNGEKIIGSIKIVSDTDLYLECEQLYNIKLDYGEGSYNIYGKEGEVITNEFIPTKEHARFLGWALNGQIILSPDLSYTIDISQFNNYTLRLTPIWEEAYQLSFSMDGGNFIEPIYGFSDQPIILPVANRDHYVFTGWLSEDDQLYNVNDIITLDANTKFTATWRAEKYIIHFDTKNTGNINNLEVSYDEIIELPTISDIEGMKFDGWNFENIFYSSQSNFTVPDLGEDGTTVWFTAKFSKKSFLFNLNLNGGNFENSTTSNMIEAEYGEEIVFPDSYREGYDFAGWECEGKIFKDSYIVEDLDNLLDLQKRINCIAKWNPKTVTITLDYGDYERVSGDDVAQISFVVGSSSLDLPTPIYTEPYIFSGWSTEKDVYKQINFSTILSDKIIYAYVTEEQKLGAFGSGTSSDPYRVYTNTQLDELSLLGKAGSTIFSGAHLKFMNDLEIVKYDYYPSQQDDNWSIYIDGNNKTLTLSTQLLNNLNGYIKNLNLKYEFTFVQQKHSCNSLVTNNKGTIENVTILEDDYYLSLRQDNSLPYTYSALLCAFNYGTISNCNNYANVNVSAYGSPVFAIFASYNYGVITKCNNYGNIVADATAKVSVFASYNLSNITNCNSEGDITAFRIGVISFVQMADSIIRVNNCNISGNFTIYGDTEKSNILGTISTSSVDSVYIDTINISNSNLNIVAIGSVSPYHDGGELTTDLNKIKSLCPNIDFDTIVRT